jgi:hypothetical protein
MHIIPERVFIIRTYRFKYANCKNCNGKDTKKIYFYIYLCTIKYRLWNLAELKLKN